MLGDHGARVEGISPSPIQIPPRERVTVLYSKHCLEREAPTLGAWQLPMASVMELYYYCGYDSSLYSVWTLYIVSDPILIGSRIFFGAYAKQ
ncbi:hypothetical protein P171DRAFT_432786 [Karstenula rhodostoma CBS 690.94]|uniref:Uncharacterized protein n=1 Tax=Karstenula rhodostoma CBS 690.94 TaxID=1392251 RepID=A0A9P4PIG5_9PLEO|nr:hypothetical protein P171DRAFT_432786 [Karstenula rhodostoma CBS 690.94]